ncbi:unnamed protein product [Diatraea saccharalis]|uniref:Uncharacterized protein n=1 Tax=Diatraea saccharalis TaxID=40085 RepID=A0A9N9REI5_9NEOP|nr:unnamed protein product [Diatraea saccharalis]
MNKVQAITWCTLLLSIATRAQQQTTDSTDDDRSNSIDQKPSVRLDPYIRKALLKALSELEESDNLSTGTDTTEESSTVDSSIYKTDSIAETLQPPAPEEKIQIHSFVVNGQAAFANSTNVTPTIIDNRISILSTTAGNVENHVTATLPTQTPFSEAFQSKDSSINIQQVRSIQTTLNTDTTKSKNQILTTKPTTIKTTTTTTTTTTTPKPTHNEDGENIEEVDKKDVQVFQAPLVAAFTVHQDAQGLPKKVIPIYQQTNRQTISPTLPSGVLSTQFTRQTSTTQNLNVSPVQRPEFIEQQLALQKQLEEKQKILEEQLRLLQQQQRQQEELLRKQQYLLQQKEAQRQQQLLFDQEQLKRQQLQANNVVNQIQGLQKNLQQIPFLNQNIPQAQNSQVSIQPSVTLDQNNLVGNQQQLPNREAVDFLLHLRSQQSEQFPLQENHLPQGISNFLQPNPISNFQGSNFNQLRLNDQFGQQKQSHRVFRHESSVGNFGFNNQNYNRFSTFTPINSNRFFPFNRPNQFNPDLELKQLLVQNGLNGRSHEDLNIVTKVLSLNHGIPLNGNISNKLPFDSRRHVRPNA